MMQRTYNDIIVYGRVLPATSEKVHQNQEVYCIFGLIGAIKMTHYKNPPKVLVCEKNNNCMGQMTAILYNMGSSDKKREPSAKQSDIATTLLSRDWKGLSNYASNGVIEIEKIG